MKTILFLSTLLLITNLYSRVNPFEPTQTYLDKKENYIKEQQKQKELLKQQKLEDELKRIEQEIAQKEEKVKIPKKKVEEKVVLKEVKKPIVEENKQPLPFISLSTIQNNLMIEVDKKYSFLQTLVLPDQKKILFDFIGNESFYTIREDLKNKYFNSYTIGTHQKEKFFRIVINLTNNIQLYKSAVDKKNNIIIVKPFKKR